MFETKDYTHSSPRHNAVHGDDSHLVTPPQDQQRGTAADRMDMVVVPRKKKFEKLSPSTAGVVIASRSKKPTLPAASSLASTEVVVASSSKKRWAESLADSIHDHPNSPPTKKMRKETTEVINGVIDRKPSFNNELSEGADCTSSKKSTINIIAALSSSAYKEDDNGKKLSLQSLSLTSPLLALDDDQELLSASNETASSCCVMTLIVPPSLDLFNDDQVRNIATIQSLSSLVKQRLMQTPVDSSKGTLTHAQERKLKKAVHHWFCYEADDVYDMVAAVRRHRQIHSNRMARAVPDSLQIVGSNDFAWWADGPSRANSNHASVTEQCARMPLWRFAMLRRIASPVILRMVKSKCKSAASQATSSQTRILRIDVSVLDIMLNLDILQATIVDAVCNRLLQMERSGESYDQLVGLQERLLSQLDKVVDVLGRARCIDNLQFLLLLSPHIEETRHRLLQCLPNTLTASNITNGQIGALHADTRKCIKLSHAWRMENNHNNHDTVNHVSLTNGIASTNTVDALANSILQTVTDSESDIHDMEARSCPPGTRPEHLAIRRERQKLLNEWKRRRAAEQEDSRRSRRKIKPRGRLGDGSSIITCNEMSITSFMTRTELMDKVNATFTLEFIPGYSRPKLRQLDLSKASHLALKNLFFDSDGSLSDAIKNDIDVSVKNDPRYITFVNQVCLDERNDKRWQVPVRKPAPGGLVKTRSVVESILAEEKVIEPDDEMVLDIGLLFGGTEDQSLHHDTARQTATWVTEQPSSDNTVEFLKPLTGWEVDTLDYNDAMASPHAPSSLLVGLGESDEVFLGVQKDQVERISGDTKQCRIYNGDGQIFDIVRENEYLVVLKIKKGCMFTGDFQHAGVRNFPCCSTEESLLEKLNENIKDIIARFPTHDRMPRNKAMVDMMCAFPGLNKLCRLHCSTEMLHGNLCIPQNTVGFHHCWANHPDPRCLQDDMA